MLPDHEIVYPPPRDSSVSNLIFQSSTSRKPSQPFRTKAGQAAGNPFPVSKLLFPASKYPLRFFLL